MPFGFGIHPYFNIIGTRKETYIQVPAQAHMEAIALLPTGKLEPLEGSPYDLRRPASLENVFLDDVYWGMQSKSPANWESRDKGIKVTLNASEQFTHMVIYSPKGEPFFCMENYTCSTDAHNLLAKGFKKQSHLLIVEPGKIIQGQVKLSIERK